MAEHQNLSEKFININKLPSVAKDFSTYNFWHYSRLQKVNLILKNGTFRLRNLTKMNDKNEKELHSEDGAYIHTLCFCNSNTEKIPMWYLYSGITGNGAAIGITPSVMLNFINSINEVNTSEGKTLFKGKDFELDCGWVCYRKKSDTSQVFYRNKWYKADNTDTLKKSTKYFIKDYPWEYEREFRIIIKNKTGTPYDYLEIKYPEELYKKFKIKLAPEISESEFLNLIPELEGFHKLIAKKTLYSTLGVEMDLVKNNIESFLDYFNSCDIEMLSKEEKEKISRFVSKYKEGNKK